MAVNFPGFIPATCHIHFTAENRFEVCHGALFCQRGFTFRNQLFCRLPFVSHLSVLVRLRCIRSGLECCQLFFGRLHDAFCFSAHFVGVVKELFDTHHVAMVRHRHAAHAVADSFVNQIGNGSLAVENGILGVYV